MIDLPPWDRLRPGRALDVGCGTGTHARYLAERGWSVVGLDVVPQALRAARRADVAGVVEWVRGDVRDLSVDGGFTLIHDRGCFHGLSSDDRDRYVDAVTRVAEPGAVFMMMAFAPHGGPGPSGASKDEICDHFGEAWMMSGAEPDTGPDPRGPMRHVTRTWYRLTRC